MLRFISVAKNLQETPGTTLIIQRDAIFPSLELAQADSRADSILVYDASMIPNSESDQVKLNISDARNGVPYRPPISVTAAGGYVIREKSGERELLLIFRRGVWDLPKGKTAPGESFEETALREVAEEVGAEDLRIVNPLGTTAHGYVDETRYAVKTTQWYLMKTSSETFTPQRSEQLEEVRWVSWKDARKMLGFDTLRDHMDSIRF